MATTTNFSIRLDDELKQKSFAVIEGFGLTPSQAIRLMLKQIADTESLPISFEKRKAHTLSKNGERLLQESIRDFENGDFSTYGSLDELNQAMEKIARGEL